MTILGYRISLSRRVRNKLYEYTANKGRKQNPVLYGLLLGRYNSRFFGLCIYKQINHLGDHIAKIEEEAHVSLLV